MGREIGIKSKSSIYMKRLEEVFGESVLRFHEKADTLIVFVNGMRSKGPIDYWSPVTEFNEAEEALHHCSFLYFHFPTNLFGDKPIKDLVFGKSANLPWQEAPRSIATAIEMSIEKYCKSTKSIVICAHSLGCHASLALVAQESQVDIIDRLVLLNLPAKSSLQAKIATTLLVRRNKNLEHLANEEAIRVFLETTLPTATERCLGKGIVHLRGDMDLLIGNVCKEVCDSSGLIEKHIPGDHTWHSKLSSRYDPLYINLRDFLVA